MEQDKQLQELSVEQVSSIAGGEGECTAVATVGTSGASVVSPGATPADAMIAIYEGFVQTTSYIIERVADSW